MKSKTKKRIAAAAIGVAAFAGAAYALSASHPKPKPMFNADTPFFTPDMDVATPSIHKPKRKQLPATKRMFGTDSYRQYKVLGKMDDAVYTTFSRVRPMAPKPTRLSRKGGAFIAEVPNKFQKSQYPRSATLFATDIW